MEKELITKKLCIKLITRELNSLWAILIFSVFVYAVCGTCIYAGKISEAKLLYYIFIHLALLWTALICYFLADLVITIVKLYSGKCYIKEMSLSTKDQEEYFEPRRRGVTLRIKYIFIFSKYGKFIQNDRYDMYYWSEKNKMDMNTFYLGTEPGDKFYVLIRGGKKKKIFEIFHHRFFELDKDNFSFLFNKYYI